MRRCRPFLALLAFLLACSSVYEEATPCVTETDCREVRCTTVADCPAATPCISMACASGVCLAFAIASGAPAPAQIEGDCKTRICNGTGSFIEEVAPGDIPVDGNECTEDLCTGDIPSNPAKPEGTSCSAGTCTKSGVCGVCQEGSRECTRAGSYGAARTCNASGQWTTLACPSDASYCADGACHPPLHATQVATGGGHTCALFDDGSIKCWGSNTTGQLGQEDKLQRGDGIGPMGNALKPVALPKNRKAKQIVIGADFTCAVLDDASIVCWGANGFGQLGRGPTNNPIGDAEKEMGDYLVPVSLGTGRSVVYAEAGTSFICAILDNGKRRPAQYTRLRPLA